MTELRATLTDPALLRDAATSQAARNTYITERMYGIDLQYTRYENALTTYTSDVNFLAGVTNLGLTGTASVLNVPQTNKILSAIASGVTGASQEFNKDVLMSLAIQNLQMQMRTDRNDIAKGIIANMKSSIADYPLGMALSDLEAYYRAGTLESAQITLTKTVGNAESLSKLNKDTVNPSKAISVPAAEKLDAATGG